MVIHLGRSQRGSRGKHGLHFHHSTINHARSRRGRGVGADRNEHHIRGDHGSLHLQGCEQFLVDDDLQVVSRNDLQKLL